MRIEFEFEDMSFELWMMLNQTRFFLCSISNLIGKNVPSGIIQSIYRHNSHDIVIVFSRANLILYTFIIQIQITIMILLFTL